MLIYFYTFLCIIAKSFYLDLFLTSLSFVLGFLIFANNLLILSSIDLILSNAVWSTFLLEWTLLALAAFVNDEFLAYLGMGTINELGLNTSKLWFWDRETLVNYLADFFL